MAAATRANHTKPQIAHARRRRKKDDRRQTQSVRRVGSFLCDPQPAGARAGPERCGRRSVAAPARRETHSSLSAAENARQQTIFSSMHSISVTNSKSQSQDAEHSPAEDLLVDDRGAGQAVEAVGERLPKLDVVPVVSWCVMAWNGMEDKWRKTDGMFNA